MVFWVVLVLLLIGAAYFRFAPHDPARWHTDVPSTQNKVFAGGVIRAVVAPGDALEKLAQVAEQSGATRIAGSVSEGHVTYFVRSRVFGFPDYITLQNKDGVLLIWSRLRFGKSDMGVNGARLTGWLERAGLQT